jgi:hypothetical protein
VRDGHDAVVAARDRERRARHRAGDAEGATGAAHEGGLAGAELAGDEHDVAGPQALGELGGERLGLLWFGRFSLDRSIQAQ